MAELVEQAWTRRNTAHLLIARDARADESAHFELGRHLDTGTRQRRPTLHWLAARTLTSKVQLKAMLNSPRMSLAKTRWKVCLKSAVLNESPIIMWPLHSTATLGHLIYTLHACNPACMLAAVLPTL